jgi:hypothetical protein
VGLKIWTQEQIDKMFGKMNVEAKNESNGKEGKLGIVISVKDGMLKSQDF